MVTVNITNKLDYLSDEAYKSLRANLMFCGKDKKAIALTSCTPSEGKSAVSMNLCISLAEAGYRVLLIDADLRNSMLLGRVQVREKVKGLAHFLSNQAQLNDIICMTNIPRFHMIFAGPVPPNPAELLGTNLFSGLVSTMKRAYDFVIIDTPPLGRVIDCAVIAQCCDGVMMVIESEAISYRFAQEVKNQLEKTKCPILGVILNKVDQDKNGYYGKYGKYGKYGSYGQYGKHKEA